MVLIWFIACLVSAGYGSKIGAVKHADWAGFFLGLLFGPVGIVAAGFVDNRRMCPKCGGRLNGSDQFQTDVCEHCHVELTWLEGVPHTKEMARQLVETARRKSPGTEPTWDQTLKDAAELLQGAAQ